MPSTPSTSDDEPIEGVVVEPLISPESWEQCIIGFDGASDDGAVVYHWPSHGLYLMSQLPDPMPSTHYVVDEHGVRELIKPEALAFTKGPHYRGE